MIIFQQVSRYLVGLIAGLSLLGCDAPPLSQAGHQLQIGASLWPGYEPLYLARNLNYWDTDQIRLIEYPSSTESLRAFRNGSIDAASLTMDEALSLFQDKIPIYIVLIHDYSNGADAIMAKPEIASVQDLKGKTVAVEVNALGAFVITRALSLNGLSADDINILSGQVHSHFEMYQSGLIDAAVTFEPMRTRLSNLGAREIFSSRDMPGEIVDVLVARKSYVDEYPEQIQALVEGWFRALGFLQQHPQQSYSIMSDRLNLTIEEVADMYDGITIPDRAENIRLLGNSGQQLRETVTTLNQIMVDHHLIASMVDFRNLALDTFVNFDSGSGPRSKP